MFHRKRLLKCIFQLGLALLILNVLVFSLFSIKIDKVAANSSEWIRGDWQYRRSHVINPSPGAGSNYQVRITVYYSSPVTQHYLTNWNKYAGNPLFTPDANRAWPACIYHYGIYYMYIGYYTSGSDIRLYTSTDGINFTEHPNSPVITRGPAGSWEEVAIEPHSIIYIDGQWRLYYCGRDASDVWRIGYAYSSDLITWTKYSGNPIMSPVSPETSVADPQVFLWKGKVWMQYSAKGFGGGSGWSLTVARSDDGVSFTRSSLNPIRVDAAPGGVYVPNNDEICGLVRVYENGVWEVEAFHSTDGEHYTYYNDGENVIKVGSSGQWDVAEIGHLDLVKVGDVYKCYYAGRDASNTFRIGLATTTTLTEVSDEGETVHLNGHCRTDFGDVRFTGSDGVALLDYWMETKVDGEYAVFWVKIADDLSTNPATIYIYYGNPDATTTSNGENTFLFFDDFLGTSYDSNKWQVVGSPTITVSNGALQIQRSSYSGSWSVHGLRSKTFTMDEKRLIAKIKCNAFSGATAVRVDSDYYSVGQTNKAHFEIVGTSNIYIECDRRNVGGSYLSAVMISGASADTYYTFYITRMGSSYLKGWLDGKYKSQVTSNVNDGSTYIGLFIEEWGTHGTAIGTYDYIAVAKYVDPEPSHGAWGNEEQAGAPPTPSISVSDINVNTTIAAKPCNFSAVFTAQNSYLSHYIFGTNNTGAWINDTAVSFGEGKTQAPASIIKTLNNTIGTVIQWQIWANNTAGNWTTTGIQSFTTSGNQSTIATLTTYGYAAVEYACQRKTFYANGRFWVFYYDGASSAGYSTSTDGFSWTPFTPFTSRACGAGWRFAVAYDGTRLHYVFSTGTNGDPLYYRCGLPNADGTITWLDNEQNITIGESDTGHLWPSIAIDSEGRPWVAYARKNATENSRYAYVTTSTTSNGTWITRAGFPHRLSSTNYTGINVMIVPLTNQKMLAIVSCGGWQIESYLWNGSSWSEKQTTANAITSDGIIECGLSAVNQGDDVHLVFIKDSTHDLVYTKYSYASNSWGPETIVQPAVTSETSPVLSIDVITNKLYCFWAGAPTANCIYYKVYNGSAWNFVEGSNPWIVESSLAGYYQYDGLSGFYQSYNNLLGLAYTNGAYGIYQLKFAFLTTYTGEYIIIDQALVSDERADIGSIQTVSFHAKWSNNGSDVVGGNIYVNGTKYVTNSTGWISIEAIARTEAPDNFTIIVLPDTQFYSESYPEIFDNQTQWIVNNAQSLNIVFVTHEGDIVNDYNSMNQWNNANNSMSKLDAGNVPYGVLPGNHDGAPSYLSNFNIFFNYNRFNGKSWYGGAYQNENTNNFELFHGGQDDYLIFHFQYDPSDEVLAWANSTLQNYPNRRVIVTTHSYLNADGTRTDIGNRIWEKFVAPHADQIFLVLCGHNHAETRRTDIVNGHTVYQIMANYQERTNGGNGWLRILEFHPAEDTIYVRTYSPYLNIYETDADSQFTLDYDMTWTALPIIEKAEWIITGVDCGGITTYIQTAQNPAIIWDKLVITYSADSTNPTVGQTVNFSVSAVYGYDGESVTFSYINTYRNDTHYASGNSFTDTQYSEATYLYTAENASDNLYGLTAFTSNTITVQWVSAPPKEYVIIDASSVSDNRADVGSLQTVAFHAKWGINGSDIVNGNIYVNGTMFTTNSTGWVSLNVASSSIGRQEWAVTAVNCGGVTDYTQIVSNPSIIWDQIQITSGGTTKESIMLGEDATIWFQAKYQYDDTIFDNTKGILYVNSLQMSWSTTNNRWEYQYTPTTQGTKTFTISSIQDNLYGLTIINDMAGAQTIIVWSTPFLIISSSNITELAFNSTTKTITFTVSGPDGTTGYTNITIAKTLIENITGLTMYLDDHEIEYLATSTEYTWLIHFTYTHSTHKVTIQLSQPNVIKSSNPQQETTTLLGGIIIGILTATPLIRKKVRRKTR